MKVYTLTENDASDEYNPYIVGIFDSLEAAVAYSKRLRGTRELEKDFEEAEQDIHMWRLKHWPFMHVIERRDLLTFDPSPGLEYKG